MMLHPSCNTHTMLRKDVHQGRTMLQQRTIMWRWFCIDVAWCILMCNNMFICYNNVSMCLMISRLNTHCYNVVQQSTIMLTNDQQCYIMLQHSDNAVTWMRNLVIRCDNNVTMYNNAQTCYDNVHICSHICTWCQNYMH